MGRQLKHRHELDRELVAEKLFSKNWPPTPNRRISLAAEAQRR